MSSRSIIVFTVLSLLVAGTAEAKGGKRRKKAVPTRADSTQSDPVRPEPLPPVERSTGEPVLRQRAASKRSLVGAPETHQGVYLRLHAGTNYGSISKLGGGGGLGVVIDLAAGYAVVENVILFGEFRISNGMLGGGAGALYYFSPINIAVGGSIMLVTGRAAATDVLYGIPATVSSNLGPALNLQASKEWWFADHWGIGVGVQLLLGSVKFDNLVSPNGSRITGSSTMAMFSLGTSVTFD